MGMYGYFGLFYSLCLMFIVNVSWIIMATVFCNLKKKRQDCVIVQHENLKVGPTFLAGMISTPALENANFIFQLSLISCEIRKKNL